MAADSSVDRAEGADAPRVLAVRLAPGRPPRARRTPFRVADAPRERLARAGGAALAAVLLEGTRRDAEAPLVIAVGDAVRRDLPTAARATVASRSPASGLYVDGQLGGSLARRLAGVADALVVSGRTDARGAVLVIGPEGVAELVARPDLVGRTPEETASALRVDHADAAIVCVGPAGEAGLAHASLFSGEDPPSSVGRGGLGAVLGRTGLKAVVVAAPVAEGAATVDADALRERLVASPRLVARAEGGTFELFAAVAARGGAQEAVSAAGIAAGAEASRTARHGCAGCPTPCGWVFERPGGGRRGGRFSAVQALGPRLGLDEFESVLGLLEACDRVGVDAKETGEALALLARARAEGRLLGPPLVGDARALAAEVEALANGAGALAGGAEGVARAAGLEHALRRARGQSVRERGGLAGLLGQCVSPRGADPMRAFPFLAEEGAPRLDARALGLPFALPEGATDPARPEGKGRLVWWHENLSAALDATGFCAFSAGALLADGGATAEELAAWILPAAWRDVGTPAEALQALGASVILVQRAANREWGETADADLPEWARERIERSELWGEYRALRGLDADGAVRAETLERLGTRALARPAVAFADGAPRTARVVPAPPTERAPGRIELRASGALGRLLAGAGAEWTLPMPVDALRAELRRRDPRAERWVGADGAPLATVWRGGRRLAEDELVRDGDVLELVVAISGG